MWRNCKRVQCVKTPIRAFWGGGKSTYLQTLAQLVILAQIGCFLPAHYASLRISSSLFTRMGTSDSIEASASSFLIEMKAMTAGHGRAFRILYDFITFCWASPKLDQFALWKSLQLHHELPCEICESCTWIILRSAITPLVQHKSVPLDATMPPPGSLSYSQQRGFR